MKKNILLFLVFLSYFFTYSQKNISVFTGINYSYLTDGFASQIYAENSFGLQLGVLYELELKEKISFRPKLYFSQQGDRTKTSQIGNLELNQIDYKLTYLNTSMDFKFWDKIYLLAGPQIGFLINQKKGNVDLGKAKSIDFGINLGTGFKIKDLFFELGIYQGISSIIEYQYFTGSTVKVKNGYAKFTIGYNF